MRAACTLLCLLSTLSANADELCATSEENDARLRAFHERPVVRSRIGTNAAIPKAVMRDGAFYVQADESSASGYNKFDLGEQSLIFEPRPQSKYAMRREASRYVEPSGDPLYDFESRTRTPWHALAYDLQSFTLPLFGKTVSRVWLTAFNGIHLSLPAEIGAQQIDVSEAALMREPVLSPLMISNRKPRYLLYPKVWVSETADALRITWRSTGGEVFAYDVQAELRRDGTIVYSYRTPQAMRWGTPIVSAGFESFATAERVLGGIADAAGDLAAGTAPALAPMLDIRELNVMRIDETELFAVKVKLGAAVDGRQLGEGQSIRYNVQVGSNFARLDVTRDSWSITSFAGGRAVTKGVTARVEGDTFWIYGTHVPAGAPAQRVSVFTIVLPGTRTADFVSRNVAFGDPQRRIASDLSAVSAGSELSLPIVEPFVLPQFDPFAVWEKLQDDFALSDYTVDAVAMYQTFYTDLIFYAGAYATGGNAQVDGIEPESSFSGSKVPRGATLLHMNQLGYNYNAAEQTASKVLMHEFGHRWLYFISIKEGSATTRSLNPLSAHPAGYVHTPAAFPVYGAEESSVMGGGYFSTQSNGSFRARAANMGYSWTDLYLMGLAAPEEVAPWFYLANTSPALPQEYWPTDGTVVSGERREVSLSQVTAVHGLRDPSTALSQKAFRVLFVLITENGAPPTEAEVAKLNEHRALLERNFAIATGGRGRIDTSWTVATRRRPAR